MTAAISTAARTRYLNFNNFLSTSRFSFLDLLKIQEKNWLMAPKGHTHPQKNRPRKIVRNRGMRERRNKGMILPMARKLVTRRRGSK